MKEGDNGSATSEDRSIIPEWASLLPELVQAIADCVLSTTTGGGVDAYMDMRAVCTSWRSAIAKPPPLAAFTDHRFRPRHWLMLDLQSENPDDGDEDARLFLHAPTGRFRRQRLPVLCDHVLIGTTTDGLLVLGDGEPPHLVRVLDPLTGDMLHFAAPLLPEHFEDIWSTAMGGGSHSTATLVLWKWNMIMYAAPTSHAFTEDTATCFSNMVTFQGDICCADGDGWIYKFVAPADQCDDARLVLIAQVSPEVDVYSEQNYGGPSSYVVESGGELLYIRHLGQALKVFRVDIEHKLLEEVDSLGGRHVLFLGAGRCVSVDAENLPSVHGGCIYYMLNSIGPPAYDQRDLCVYNLRDDIAEIITGEDHLDRPFSLVQFLLRYCDFRS